MRLLFIFALLFSLSQCVAQTVSLEYERFDGDGFEANFLYNVDKGLTFRQAIGYNLRYSSNYGEMLIGYRFPINALSYVLIEGGLWYVEDVDWKLSASFDLGRGAIKAIGNHKEAGVGLNIYLLNKDQ